MSPLLLRKVPLVCNMGLNREQIASLIVKYLRRTLSEAEMSELQAWLKDNEQNKRLLASFEQEGYTNDEIAFVEDLNIDAAWKKVNARKSKKEWHISLIKWTTSLAALIALIFGLKLWFVLPKSSPSSSSIVFHGEDIPPGSKKAELILSDGTKLDLTKPVHTKERNGTQIHDEGGNLNYLNSQAVGTDLIFNTLNVPKTGTYQLTLPDGTKVWLNAMSTLKFPVQFLDTERSVYLEGEAYFEVAKDPSKPFVVKVRGTKISVLGTTFNINAYTTNTATTLLSGAVKVSHGSVEELLRPGQEAKIEANKISIRRADLNKVIAWKQGDFYFDKDNIVEIMQELQRWYDFDVAYSGKIPKKLISGNISRGSKLSEVLEMLNFVSNDSTRFEVNDRKVSVLFPEK